MNSFSQPSTDPRAFTEVGRGESHRFNTLGVGPRQGGTGPIGWESGGGESSVSLDVLVAQVNRASVPGCLATIWYCACTLVSKLSLPDATTASRTTARVVPPASLGRSSPIASRWPISWIPYRKQARCVWHKFGTILHHTQAVASPGKSARSQRGTVPQ